VAGRCADRNRRLFVAKGKGGHQRVIPVAMGSCGRWVTTCGFLRALGDNLHGERPVTTSTDRVLWCSRARGADCRCRLRAWMRSSPVPAGVRGWSARPG
jgi:hypothetical protein